MQLNNKILTLTILHFLVKIGQSADSSSSPLRVTRVINGYMVLNGEAPHQVALFLDGDFNCGGSLIQEQTVLTAGHCVVDRKNNIFALNRFRVRYNTLDRTSGLILNVSKVILHPEYNFPTADIAILHLSGPIQADTNAKVISLIPNRPPNGSAVTVTGWGWYNLSDIAKSSLQLLSCQLTLYSQEECKELWGDCITDGMMCAASSTHSTCMGDSGGPPTFQDLVGGQEQLVGVLSFGNKAIECKPSKGAPNVFTDVTFAPFRSWIQNNTYGAGLSGYPYSNIFKTVVSAGSSVVGFIPFSIFSFHL